MIAIEEVILGEEKVSCAVQLRDLEGNLLQTLTSEDDFYCGVDWSPDGRYLVAIDTEGNLYLWEAHYR